METLARRSIVRYGVAIAAILLATVLRLLLDSELGDQHPLTFYLCAVAFVSWFGGLGPAVLTLVAGMIVGDWFFVEPRFTLFPRDLPGWIGSWVYLASGLVIIYFSRATHAAYHRASVKATALLNRQLQQRVAELETLLDLVPVGVLIAEDAQCQKMRPNRAMAQLFNVPRETNFSLTAEGNRLPWRLFRQGRELVPEERPFQRSATTGVEVHQEECEYVFDDGRRLSVEIYATPLFDHEHKSRGCIGVVIDRTQQKAEQEKLARSENRYRSLVTATSAVVWLTDEIGQVTAPQEPWEAYTGQIWEEYKGSGWLNAVHPDDRKEVTDAWDRARQSGTLYQARGRLWHPAAQQYRYCRSSGVPVRNDSGRIVEWVGMCIDIDEYIRLRQALEASEKRLRLALQVARMAAWEWDPATGKSIYSTDAPEMLGLPADKTALTGEEVLALVHPEDREHVQSIHRQATREKASFCCRYRIVRPRDGKALWIEDSGGMACDEAGNAIKLMGVARDVTEETRLEQELQQRAEELAESDRKKDVFLAMLGHELRNPLAGIANGIQVLKMVGPGSQDAEEMREVIERQASHMAHLIDDLLDVSRISRGKIQLRRRQLDLAELARKTVETYRLPMEEQGLLLTLDLPAQPVGINADPTRITQVVGNLLNNAMKFTDAGGQITVAVAADQKANMARVTVKDTGIGIESHLLEQLFEPFSQADSSLDRTRGGLGLGLALVKGLVEMHGGDVMACSAGLGQGTEVQVRLPLAGGESEAQPPATEHPAAVRSHRVLLIDDRRDAILPLKKMLKWLGQEVEVADSGKSGLAKAWEFRPEIVLCDIGLPDINGYEVAQAMRADPTLRSAYLVAVTGYGQDEDKRRAVRSGFDYHVTKPVALAQLENLLAELPHIPMSSGANQ